MHPRSLKEILQTSTGRSGGLRAKADLLASLDDKLRRWLPQPLSAHVRLVALEQDRVAIWADSAAWRSRLHYQLPQVRQILAQRLGLQVVRIDTGVMATTERLERPQRRAMLGTEAAENLERAASSLGDPKLAAALRRLAARGRK